ncbi:MAG: hypothetical protein ACK5WB_01430 [Phycisphaerales bacterium]|jgi:hypothetical protein|nr:hypothetical protein [Phycisphaeraceae bacterium]
MRIDHRRLSRHRGNSGFTLVEAAALLVVAAVGGALMHAANPISRARESARTLTDSTNQRNMIQAMITWAVNNKEILPLPSMLDRSNTTVKETGRAKDTSANIMSMLVFNQSLTPEVLISPLEINPKISVHKSYQFMNPSKAVDKAKALWDPGFSADFTSTDGGHLSYAHTPPTGTFGEKPSGRAARWMVTFSAEETLTSNRGPEVTKVTYAADATPPGDDLTFTAEIAKAESLAMKFFPLTGEPGAWTGSVSYADGRVQLAKGAFAPGKPAKAEFHYATQRDGKDAKRPDVLFFDEADDKAENNSFHSVFIKAGDKKSDFKPIWD